MTASTTCSRRRTSPTRAAPTRSASRPALAKGARALGVAVVKGVSVTGLRTDDGRVVAVLTDAGEVECETVVLAAGLWARELGGVPGSTSRCRLPSTTTCSPSRSPGVHRDLPVIEDPDRYGYYREEGGGLLVGLFEPVGAPWQLDGPPPTSPSARSRPTGSG